MHKVFTTALVLLALPVALAKAQPVDATEFIEDKSPLTMTFVLSMLTAKFCEGGIGIPDDLYDKARADYLETMSRYRDREVLIRELANVEKTTFSSEYIATAKAELKYSTMQCELALAQAKNYLDVEKAKRAKTK